MAQPADTVILNGNLITFNVAQPKAQALAITGGRITAVGSNADIRERAAPDTRTVDAGGATVLPGFIDSHVHLFGGSVELGYLDLYGVEGEDQLTPKVRTYAAECPDDRIVFADAPEEAQRVDYPVAVLPVDAEVLRELCPNRDEDPLEAIVAQVVEREVLTGSLSVADLNAKLFKDRHVLIDVGLRQAI